MDRVRVKIHGRVQGVFFRAETRRKARGLGLRGFVRNTPDGCVELEACGEMEKLEKLIEWSKTGPPAAKVDKIDISWDLIEESPDEFEITY